MRILFLTFGLLAHNTKLMPWRTAREVVSGMRQRGCYVDLVSLVTCDEIGKSTTEPSVLTIRRRVVADMRQELLSSLQFNHFDLIYVPVSVSSNSLVKALLRDIKGERVAYLPGSYFELNQTLKVLGKMRFLNILPYLAQSLFPRYLFNFALKQLSARVLITNSDYSKRALENHIRLPIISIPPGRDKAVDFASTTNVVVENLPIVSQPYFVFAGPPLAIRGIEVLLQAYAGIADLPEMPPLLCLFRSDSHLDIEAIKRDYEKKWNHKKIIFRWQSLSQQDFHLSILNSLAVIMPFLIVPSEIPLAVYEAAAMGKTIITTGPHGTGDFVQKFGLTVSPGSVSNLQKAMVKCVQNINGDLSDQAFKAYSSLDDWDSVSKSWETVLLSKHN
jgi:hypothetical protein